MLLGGCWSWGAQSQGTRGGWVVLEPGEGPVLGGWGGWAAWLGVSGVHGGRGQAMLGGA